MNRESLFELYKSKIVPLGKNPDNFIKVGQADFTINAINPLCGDKLYLTLNIQDQSVTECNFHGFGCVLSKASTSILLREIKGKTKTQIEGICKDFLQGLEESDGATSSPASDKDLLQSLVALDGRIDCIKLSWENMYNFVRNDKTT